MFLPACNTFAKGFAMLFSWALFLQLLEWLGLKSKSK